MSKLLICLILTSYVKLSCQMLSKLQNTAHIKLAGYQLLLVVWSVIFIDKLDQIENVRFVYRAREPTSVFVLKYENQPKRELKTSFWHQCTFKSRSREISPPPFFFKKQQLSYVLILTSPEFNTNELWAGPQKHNV